MSPQRLRLVVTTKKPFKQNETIVGIIGVHPTLRDNPAIFWKDTRNPWNSGVFTGGIYYMNFKSGVFLVRCRLHRAFSQW